jgi:hypothetical protein
MMPQFHFELVENGVIVENHYGLELHEIAVDDLDLAVDLAQILARRAVDETGEPAMVTINDEAKNPFARVRLSPNSEATAEPVEEPANTQVPRFEILPSSRPRIG